MFRVVTATMPENRLRLFLSIDLLIADGTSQAVLMEDLMRFYEGRSPLPLHGSFREYVLRAAARRTARADVDADVDEARIRQLASTFPCGNVLGPELTRGAGHGTSAVRPWHEAGAAPVPRMRRLERTLDEGQSRLLREQAAAHGVSPASVLCACYARALGAWATTDRIGINVTTYNRDPAIAPVEGVVGDFTGIVLVSAPSTGEDGIFALARDLGAQILEGLARNDSEVRLLIHLARRQGSLGRAVAPFVFTSLLHEQTTVDTVGEDGRSGGSLPGRIVHAISQTPQVLIDNQVTERDGRITVSWDLAEEVLDPGSMPAVFEYSMTLLLTALTGEPCLPGPGAPATGTARAAGAVPTAGPAPATRAAPATGEHVGPASRDDEAAGQPQDSRAQDHGAQTPGCAQDGQRPTAEDTTAEPPAWLGPVLTLAGQRLPAVELSWQTDLLDAGLDSLGLVELVRATEQELGTRIPLAPALRKPTPLTLARLVEEGAAGAGTAGTRTAGQRDGQESRDEDCLALIRPSSGPGARTRVVMVHGGFGSVDVYGELALRLPSSWQIWGLTFSPFERTHPRPLSMNQIARHYVSRLRSQWPDEEPVLLIGWSIGGTIATDMALQIDDPGTELVLVDSVAPGTHVRVGDFSLEEERSLLRHGGIDPLADEPPAATVEELWAGASARLGNSPAAGEAIRSMARALSPGLSTDVIASSGRMSIEQFNSLRTLVGARNTYEPCGTLAHGLVLEATNGETDPGHGWERTIPAGMESVRVEGNHYSILLSSQVTITAGIISDYMTRRAMAREGLVNSCTSR